MQLSMKNLQRVTGAARLMTDAAEDAATAYDNPLLKQSTTAAAVGSTAREARELFEALSQILEAATLQVAVEVPDAMLVKMGYTIPAAAPEEGAPE